MPSGSSTSSTASVYRHMPALSMSTKANSIFACVAASSARTSSASAHRASIRSRTPASRQCRSAMPAHCFDRSTVMTRPSGIASASANADRPVKVPRSRARRQPRTRSPSNAYCSLASIMTAGSPKANVSRKRLSAASPFPGLCCSTYASMRSSS